MIPLYLTSNALLKLINNASSQNKGNHYRGGGLENVILIIIKFCELLLRITPRIINSLRSYIKHSKECFLLFPNTSKLVKKTRLRLVFPTYFSVFGNRRKHSSSCLIYYLKISIPDLGLRAGQRKLERITDALRKQFHPVYLRH